MTIRHPHYSHLGTVSHGTMRLQDLIPAFIEELSERDPVAHAQLLAQPFPIPPAYALENDDSEWWESKYASYLLEELLDTLDALAPEYCYFGAHENDGSDYGYWPSWESIRDDEKDGYLVCVDDASKLDEAPIADSGVCAALVVNDHGNASLYTRSSPCNPWNLNWSIV